MENLKEKTQEFATLVEKQQREYYEKEYPNSPKVITDQSCRTLVRPGGFKYNKVDVGSSGKFMVDRDGNIYGIRAYGQVNKKHAYGTLETTDDWYWGNYKPVRKKK